MNWDEIKRLVNKALNNKSDVLPWWTTLAEILEDPFVIKALKDAWYDSIKFKDFWWPKLDFKPHNTIALLEKPKANFNKVGTTEWLTTKNYKVDPDFAKWITPSEMAWWWRNKIFGTSNKNGIGGSPKSNLVNEAKKYKSAKAFWEDIIDEAEITNSGKKWADYNYKLEYKNIDDLEPSYQLQDYEKTGLAKDYAKDIKWWDIFPAIQIEKNWTIINWNHRLEAYKQLWIKDIKVITAVEKGDGKLINAKEIWEQANK
jgi:hypothetical protein